MHWTSWLRWLTSFLRSRFPCHTDMACLFYTKNLHILYFKRTPEHHDTASLVPLIFSLLKPQLHIDISLTSIALSPSPQCVCKRLCKCNGAIEWMVMSARCQAAPATPLLIFLQPSAHSYTFSCIHTSHWSQIWVYQLSWPPMLRRAMPSEEAPLALEDYPGSTREPRLNLFSTPSISETTGAMSSTRLSRRITVLIYFGGFQWLIPQRAPRWHRLDAKIAPPPYVLTPLSSCHLCIAVLLTSSSPAIPTQPRLPHVEPPISHEGFFTPEFPAPCQSYSSLSSRA
jgi:hypothetical protein